MSGRRPDLDILTSVKAKEVRFGKVPEKRRVTYYGEPDHETEAEVQRENIPEEPEGGVTYRDVITYPPVRQDLAFVVDEGVPAGDLVAAAREAAGPELREMHAFDVYRGEQAGKGKKSIAFAVSFQSPERTLTDEDAAELRDRIVTALQGRFGAELRA